MIDLDKPDYDHGGGNVAYTGHKDNPLRRIEQLFTAQPPAGIHNYRFDVAAVGAGRTLGMTSSPENSQRQSYSRGVAATQPITVPAIR